MDGSRSSLDIRNMFEGGRMHAKCTLPIPAEDCDGRAATEIRSFKMSAIVVPIVANHPPTLRMISNDRDLNCYA